MKRLTSALLLSFLMTSCASSNIKPITLPPEQIIVTKLVKELPPERYVHNCGPTSSDGAILAEIARLNDLVKCERRDKAAIRAWMGLNGPSPSKPPPMTPIGDDPL